jgi:hypothetical protein
MADKAQKFGPPRILESLVRTLTPPAWRDDLSVQLRQRYTSEPFLLSYILDAAYALRRVIVEQTAESFSSTRLAGDVCCLLIAFAAAPPASMAAILAVAIAALLCRDAYSHPVEPSGAEAATDGIVVATLIILSQALLRGSAFATSPRKLAVGILIEVGLLSGWRFCFRNKTPRRRLPDPYRAAWRLNMLWAGAGYGLIIANSKILIPPHGDLDTFFAAAPIVLATFAIRLSPNWKPRDPNQPTRLFGDNEREDLAGKLARLPVWSKAFWSRLFEFLCFLSLAFPAGWGIVGVALRVYRPVDIDWLQLVANTAALIALWRIWIEMRKINEQAAETLQTEIDNRKTLVGSAS